MQLNSQHAHGITWTLLLLCGQVEIFYMAVVHMTRVSRKDLGAEMHCVFGWSTEGIIGSLVPYGLDHLMQLLSPRGVHPRIEGILICAFFRIPFCFTIDVHPNTSDPSFALPPTSSKCTSQSGRRSHQFCLFQVYDLPHDLHSEGPPPWISSSPGHLHPPNRRAHVSSSTHLKTSPTSESVGRS